MIRLTGGRHLMKYGAVMALLLALFTPWGIPDAAAQTAPDPGGDIIATDTSDNPLSITEDTATRTDFRASGINLSDAEGTPTEIRLTAVDGGVVTRNGGMSIAIGEEGTGEALALTSDMIDLEFVPAPDRDTDATITYKVVDPASDPDSSASTITISITPVNDAPSIGDGTLAVVDEDTVNPPGASVSALFDSSFMDPDTNPPSSLAGIAITNDPEAASEGTWEYSPDGGTRWFAISDGGTALSDTNALYLDAATLIRFVPAPDYDSTVSPLALRALDDTNTRAFSSNSGPNEDRETHDVSTNGGSTPISANTANLNTSINPINDAPSIGDATLAAVDEDTADPPGASVSALFDSSFSDPDTSPPPSLSGIAVVGDPVAAAEGAWEYSPDGGANWFAVSDGMTTLNDSNALYLSAATRIRFLPALNFNGAVSPLTVRALDDTNALAFSSNSGATELREVHDASTNGGTTAISGNTAELDTSINAVNDDPTFAMFPGAQSVLEDTNLVFNDGNGNRIQFADVDLDGNDMRASLSVTNGTLTLSGTTGLSAVTGNGSASITIEGPLAPVNSAVNGLTYRGIQDYFGPDTLVVTINDLGHTGSGGGGDVTMSVGITVDPVNDTPVQVTNNPLTLNQGGAAVISSSLLAYTDVDDVDSTLLYTVVTPPANGTISLGGTFTQGDINGSAVVYQHDGSATSSDAFVFNVRDDDGATTADATFNITINLAPVVDTPIDDVFVNENAPNTSFSVSGNFSDPESGPLSFAVQSVSGDPVFDGTPAFSGSTLTIAYAADAHGVADVTVRATDNGGAFVDDTFTVFVNDAPVANDDTGFNTPEDTAITVNVLANDTDLTATGAPGGLDPASVTVTSGPANGTTSVNPADGRITYTPAADYNGADSFTYTVDDTNTMPMPATSNEATVEVTVDPVNDPPALSVPGTTQTVEEGNTLTFSVSNGNPITVDDVDADETALPAGGVRVSLSATKGTLTLATTAGLVNVSGDGTASVTFDGTVPDAGAALNGLTYTPDPLENGAETISVNLSDKGNTGAGGTLQVSDTIDVFINAVNNPPVVTVPGPQSVDEDITTAIGGISVADPDAGGGDLTVTLGVGQGRLAVNTSASGGVPAGDITGNNTSTVVLTGTLTELNNTLPTLTFTTSLDNVTPQTLTVEANDNGNTGGPAETDSATVAISINPQNDDPFFSNFPGAAQTIDEDTPLQFSTANGNRITVSDVDVEENNPGGVIRVLLAASNGTLTPNGMAGLDTADGYGTANVTLQGPLASVNAALNGLTYLGNQDFNGSDTLIVTANDLGNTGAGGGGDVTAMVGINVAARNDPPVITVPAAQTVDEDTNLPFSAADGNAITVTDVDAAEAPGDLVVTLSVSNGTLTLANTAGLTSSTGNTTGSVSMTGSVAAIGSALDGLVYRPNLNYNGSDTLHITANDQGHTGAGPTGTDSASLAITVDAVNDPPQLTLPGPQTIDEDTTAAITGISVTDVDAGGGNLIMSLSVVSGRLQVSETVSGGVPALAIGNNNTNAVTLTGTLGQLNITLPTLTFTSAPNNPNNQTLTVTVDDQGNTGSGGNQVDQGTVALNITAINDDPVWSLPAAQNINEDSSLTFAISNGNALSVSDVDVAEAPGQLRITLSVEHGRLTLATTAGITLVTGSGSNDPTVTFTGTANAVNTAMDGLVYQPDTHFNTGAGQSEALAVVANDQGFTGLGGGGDITGSVPINIAAINDDPVWTVPGSQVVDEDTDLPFNGSISVSDVDVSETPGGTLRVTLGTSDGQLTLAATDGLDIEPPATGTRDGAITFTGALAAVNAALDGLVYRGTQDYNGSDTIQLTVNDQGNTGQGGGTDITAAIAITINPVNDAPVASDVVLSPAEPLRNEDLTASYVFTDVDGDAESGTTIRWFRDGALQPAFNNLLTVPMSATVEEEDWFFRVVPSDGLLPGDEVQSNTVRIRPVADLQMSIARDPSAVVPGEGVTYTFQVRNLGPSPVTGVRVVTTLPPALLEVDWTCTACGTSGSGSIDETVDLAAGETVEFELAALVNPAATGDLTVSATADPPPLVFEVNPADNTSSNTVPLMPEARLRVAMTADRATARPGEAITYTATATNDGPSDARGILFSDTPDANTALENGSVSTSTGTVSGGNGTGDSTVAVDVGTLPLGESVEITYRVVVDNPFPAEGLRQVCTRGRFTGDPDNPDVNFVDTEAPEEVCTDIDSVIDISATKTGALRVDTNGNGENNPGDTIRFTVRLVNNGDGGANQVVYANPAIPNGILIEDSITSTPPAANIGLSGGAFTVTLEHLQGSGSGGANQATLTFDVRIQNPMPPGESLLVSQGAITYDEISDPGDPVLTDNPGAVPIEGSGAVPVDGDGNVLRPAPTAIQVVAAPALVALKADDIDRDEEKRPGDLIEYTVTIENRGNQGASGLTYRAPFNDNEISEAELQQVSGDDPLSDLAGALLSNFDALDDDGSGGLSSGELAGSQFALTPDQFRRIDTTDARLRFLEDSVAVNGEPADNEGSPTELILNLGELNGRNPQFTSGPVVTITYTVELEPVLRAGISVIRCQGTVRSNELGPVLTGDPETVNVEADATQTSVRAIPELDVTPEILTINFGDQDIDDGPTEARVVELANAPSATAPLTFRFVGLEGASLGEFTILSDSRETVLRPGETRFLELAFDPGSIGNKQASLRVESDDPNDSAVDINLSGRALDSDMRVTPGALNFGKRNLLAGPSNPQSVSIINDGLGILTLDSVTLACGPDVFPVMTGERFDQLDRNGDGVLTRGIGERRELELAVDLFDIAEILIDEFSELDQDNSGDLSPAEVDERFPFLTAGRFDILDGDGSQSLSAAELDAARRLAGFAGSLLRSFEDFDINPPEGLDPSEAEGILPDLTAGEFQALDANGDGVLSTDELEERQKLARIAMQLQADFTALDTDRDGLLTRAEIETFDPLLTPGRFEVLDADENGELSRDELESSESSLAAGIAERFATLDTDASGGLTLDEINAACAFKIFSDSGEESLETAQSRLVRIVFNPSTEGVKAGTLRIEANQSGQGTPIVAKVRLSGTGNRTPRIVDQNPVTTMEDTPVTIILDNLIVSAPLLDFPEEVRLVFQPRPSDANYTRDGNEIIPNPNFNGLLSVPVTVRDGNIDSNIWNLRITVTPVNDPPTDIALSNNTVSENQPLNTVIGRFSTTDPDIGDLHVYSLVPDDPESDDDDFIDNQYFGIVADQLVTRAVFDYETRNRYTIQVRSRDPEGLAVERAFQINILDEPNDEDNSVAAEALLSRFDDTDTNGDGILSFEETQSLLPGFTQERFDTINTESEISRAELERGIGFTSAAQTLFDNFDRADSNDNGSLSLAEARSQVPSLAREALDFMDRDGNGALTPAELQTGIQLFNDLTTLLERFAELDTDGSGSLTFDELPPGLSALDRQRFDLLETNPGLSPRELAAQVTCTLLEGGVSLIQPTGDLLAPPGADLLAVTFNAEAEVNIESACSAGDIDFTYDIGAQSILITDLAEYFLQNFDALDANFDNHLAESEVAPSRIGLTPERFDIIDFNGDGLLSVEELEAAVILSDLAAILLDEFSALNADNSSGLSFAETTNASLDFDMLRYDILDLNKNGVLTRDELRAEIDLPGFLLDRFGDLDSDGDGALALPEIRAALPGLSRTRFDNLDADRDGFVTAGELLEADDFQKAFPVFAAPLPLDGIQKQLRGTEPAAFTLPVNNAYRVRVTATLPETGQSEQSAAFTFEIRNGMDNDNNGYLDFPFEDLANDGARWERAVSGANCGRQVLMHAWHGTDVPGRAIEAVLANPANPAQRLTLRVPHGLAAEGEEAILIAAFACDAESLYTRQRAGVIGSPPEDLVAGTAWVSINIIVREAGAPFFAPVAASRLTQRPVRLSLNGLDFSPEDQATFYHHETEILSDETTGLDVVPRQSDWSSGEVTNPRQTADTLRATTAALGTFIALESLKPPILATEPAIATGVNFGGIQLNETAELAVTIRNTGGERLIGAAELRDAGGVFSIIGNASYNLGHAETHTFLVRFSPGTERDFTATVAFSGDPKGQAVMDITGTGMPPKGFGCGPAAEPHAAPWGNGAVILLVLALLAAAGRRQSGPERA